MYSVELLYYFLGLLYTESVALQTERQGHATCVLKLVSVVSVHIP